jgi:predicted RNA-binding Zn-ribbon protein involved in translation (DUF1610 family)
MASPAIAAKLAACRGGIMAKEYMSELVCPKCGKTAHIVWEGSERARKVVEVSSSIKYNGGNPPSFTCLDCGTGQTTI